jgi:hypothetical protein
MSSVHLTATLLAAALTGLAAIANFIGHSYPTAQADKLKVPRSRMRPLGACLAAGSLGLLAGLAVPLIGIIAAAGLVLYFLSALVVHLRRRDFGLGPWTLFAVPAFTSFVTSLKLL